MNHPRPAAVLALLALLPLAHSLAGCAHRGDDVARGLDALVGASELQVRGETFRYDCSGLVCAAYHQVGLDLEGRNGEALFQLARDEHVFHRRHKPQPGDVAFFDNTYDRNGNRRLDDRRTHVAVVESVGDDGTIVLVHKGGSGVTRIRMNLRHRRLHADDDGTELNSFLRSETSKDKPWTKYLSGQLWAGFASLWKVDPADD